MRNTKTVTQSWSLEGKNQKRVPNNDFSTLLDNTKWRGC